MSSVSKRIVKNSLFLYFRLAYSTIAAFVVIRLLLQSLGEVNYGIYSILAGAVAMFQMVNGTLVTSTMRFIVCAEGEQDEEKKSRIFNLALRVHLWMALLVALAMEIGFLFFWERIFNIPAERVAAAKIVFQFMVVLTFCNTLTNPYEALIISHERMAFFALWGIVQATGKLLLSLVLFYFVGDRLILYGAGMLAIFGGAALWRVLFCRKFPESRVVLGRKIDLAELRALFLFSGWTFCGNVSNAVLTSGNSLLLNHFFGVLVNAAEGVAAQISGQLSIFATTIMQAVNPVIMKYESSNNTDRALSLTCMSSKFIGLVFLFMAIPFLFEADFVLSIWLKEVPEYAVVFCRLAVIRVVFTLLSTPFVTYLNATGNIRNFELTDGAVHILTLVAGFVWLKFGGAPVTVYICVLICVIVRMACRIFWVVRNSGFDPKDFLIGCLGRCALVGGVVSLLLWPLMEFMDNGWMRFFAVCVSSVLLMAIAIWFLGVTQRERQLLLDLVKRKRAL